MPQMLGGVDIPTVWVAQHSGSLVFWCRYCRTQHSHGCGGDQWKPGDDISRYYGHRVAHCFNPDSPYKKTGYVLVEGSEEDATKPVMYSGIYFVQMVDTGHIKIGRAVDVPRRIKIVQVGNASALKLLAVMPGTPTDERALHKRFAHLHVRGEWFAPTEELMIFIAGIPPTDVA